jgi:hypothetical protein
VDTCAFVDSIGEVYDDVTDAFGGSESSTWGTTDTGQAWSNDGGSASDYSVGSGTGSLSLGSVAVSRRPHLAGVSVADADSTVTITVPALATGASMSVGVTHRYADSSNHLRAELVFQTTNDFIIRLVQASTSGGAQIMASSAAISSYTAASSWKLRAQIIGRRYRAKAWAAADPEPADWNVTGLVTDAAVVAAADAVGIRAIRETSNSNGTVAFLFDDFTVSSPSQIRLDLNDGTTWGLDYQGTSLDPPPRKYVRAGGLMSQGETIPAGAYANRTLRLSLGLNATSLDDIATKIQQLQRELDRTSNVLLWQPAGATHPVYFRTLWSADQQMQVFPGDGLYREIRLEMQAEPFAYGLLQTLDTATVTNNPASSCYFDLAAADIIGDVETPAIMTFAYAGVEDMGPTAVGVRRHGTPSLMPTTLQCEAMTGGTDTTIQANDAVMSGSGQNYMRCTYATVAATMTVRLTSSTFPSTPGEDVRGTYRAFLRYRKSSSSNPINVQLGWSFGSTSASNREVALASTTDRRWVDLGLLTYPFGADPIHDLSGVEIPARGGVITISAQRTSGSGNTDFDAIVLVPADPADGYCLVTWPTSSGPTLAVLDGNRETIYNLGGSAEVYPRELPNVRGVFPHLTPSQDHRIVVLLNAGGGSSSDDITDTVDVTVSYYPRYLLVRPATT